MDGPSSLNDTPLIDSGDSGTSGAIAIFEIAAGGLLTSFGVILSIAVRSSCCCCECLLLDDLLSLLVELVPRFYFTVLSTAVGITAGSTQIATPPGRMTSGFVNDFVGL